MVKIAKSSDLRIGQRVSVKRCNGEIEQGVISKGPIDYIRHIGEFYIVRRHVTGFIGKSIEPEIGMYERSKIRLAQ